MAETPVTDLVKTTPSAIEGFDATRYEDIEKLRKALADSAKERRKKKTPKQIRKSREVGGGKTATYVDRPNYQIWLDENFPGWSVSDFKQWTDSATILAGATTQSTPILFNISFILHVVESTGVKRTIPCVGYSPVSSKEIGRDNSQLLTHKYDIATTNAYKMGVGWLGGFFDLRVDEEELERKLTPPTKLHQDKFAELLEKVPEAIKPTVRERWETQNFYSADKFLVELEAKLIQSNKGVTQDGVKQS